MFLELNLALLKSPEKYLALGSLFENHSAPAPFYFGLLDPLLSLTLKLMEELDHLARILCPFQHLTRPHPLLQDDFQ